jgi:hypothetical protein
MAAVNLNLALNTLCTVNAVKPGNAVVGTLGLWMPTALSHGRPMSPGFATFEPIMAKAKRIGRSAAGLPGYPVRPRYWRESDTGATQVASGRSAIPTCVSGRGLSERCAQHHLASGHEYPSHDRRDDQRITAQGQQQPVGLALYTNRGK